MKSTVSHYMTIPDGKGANRYGYFRALIPSGAVLQVFAEKLYELRVNGEFLAYGPSKSAIPLCFYDVFPLPETPQMHEVAFKVHSGRLNINLLVSVTLPDGSEFEPEWKCKLSKAYDGSSLYTVGEVGYCEYFDFAANENEWWTSSFFKDASAPVQGDIIEAKYLRERPIPLLKETKRIPVKQEKIDGDIYLDFGEILYARIVISGKSKQSGDLRVMYIEDEKTGWAHKDKKPCMYEDHLKNLPETFSWKSFTKRGFRIVRLTGLDIELDDVHAMEYSYSLKAIGQFQCSDEKLNQIWEISRTALRTCMDDIYNDCPHRDQAQWMDAFISSQAALGYGGVKDLTRKCVLQFALSCPDSGRMLAMSSTRNTSYLPDYAMLEVMFARWYYLHTGDKSLLAEVYEYLEKMIAYIQGLKADDHLIEHLDLKAFLYLDNTFELCRKGKSAAFNALYYGALNAMADILEVLGRSSEKYRREAELVRKSFKETFENADGSLRDSDSRPETELSNFNFFNELDNSLVSGARVRFNINRDKAEQFTMLSGAYAEYRIILNGKTVLNDGRKASWSRVAPCYALDVSQLTLQKGENTLVFEVKNNDLNWDLFFRADGIDFSEAEIQEIDYRTGQESGITKTAAPRKWYPPKLSQSTHAFAAFCGLIDDPKVMSNVLPEHYYRNYISVRVPLFSTEQSNENWIMPCNTPNTSFYFLQSLFQLGLGKEATDWIRMAWGVMVDNGATSTWEEFNVNASLCHAWGAAPMVFFMYEILGVKLGRLHENIITVVPDLCGLESARGRVAVSDNKYIEVELNKEVSGTTNVKIGIPAGTEVNIDLSRLQSPELEKFIIE